MTVALERTSPVGIDADVIAGLPLPLAQLYHGVQHRPQKRTPLEVFLAASQLWEAALKLLAATAIAEFARLRLDDPAIQERVTNLPERLAKIKAGLTNLARPSLGHWWSFVKLLLPFLAESGDRGFQQVQHTLLEATQRDCPRAAALDVALQEALKKRTLGPRQTVRLRDLFDGLVWLRNRETGHGTPGKRPKNFYAQWSEQLLSGIFEVMSRLDVLAGRRLLYVPDVSRQADGTFHVERYEVMGETGRMLERLAWHGTDASQLPVPGRIYLVDRAAPERSAVSLHPLLVFDADEEEVLFLNDTSSRLVEYLGYRSGRTVELPGAAAEMEALLARLLGNPVNDQRLAEWAQRAAEEAVQEKQEAVQDEEPPAPINLAPDRRLGDFELLTILGEGGMGRVYRARQISLGRQVALKCLNPGGNKDRFAREIRALGQVKHPNLVEIYTSGSDSEDWFYAMELVHGATLAAVTSAVQSRMSTAELNLATWNDAVKASCDKARQDERSLSKSGRAGAADVSTASPDRTPEPVQPQGSSPAAGQASPPQVSGLTNEKRSPGQRMGMDYVRRLVELMCQIARAAHALHDKGVVHRDIKPGNIMVTADGGQAVLMDLGLAKLIEGEDLTTTKDFLGTVPYASPEQVHSSKMTDRRADVYSLGATLWELLTFQPSLAITRQTPPYEAIQRVLFTEPDAIRKYNRHVPPELDAIVAKCLEKDPKDRYVTALDLAEDLQRFLDGEPPLGIRQSLGGRVRRLGRWLGRRAKVAAVVIAVPVVLLLSVFAYNNWRPQPAPPLNPVEGQTATRVEYYANLVKRRGFLEGIHSVTAAQARQRAVTWKFTVRGKLLEKVEAINGHGYPTTEHGATAFIRRLDEAVRECTYIYRRDDQGGILEEIALDRNGEVVWKFRYTTATRGVYLDKRGVARVPSGTSAAYVGFVYTDEGFEKEVHYLDRQGKPHVNQDGAFTFDRELDKRGLSIRDTYLDLQGKPIVNKSGFAKAVAKYDEQGNRIEAAFFGADDRPTLLKDGFAKWTATYDQRGNQTEFAHFDRDGKPTFHKDGYSRDAVKYDGRGNRIEVAYLDAAGKPTLHVDGFAKFTAKHDERGNRIDVAYFDAAGKPTLHVDGFASFTNKYDDHGNPIEEAYFDPDGKPTLHNDGYAKDAARFDKRSNVIERRYFGLDGKPALHVDGYASFTAKYDEHGDRIEEAYFGVDGLPTLYQRFARSTAKYDERGNLIEEAYFDTEGQPTLHEDGYAKYTCTYDDRGNCTETSFFGKTGKLVARDDGIARWTARYDERAKETERSFFDELGLLVRKTGPALFHVNGRLTTRDPKDSVHKDSPHKVHTVVLVRGMNYSLDLESKDFDPLLRLEDAAGKQLDEDDDSAGKLNARILFKADRDGPYRLIATSFNGRTGLYALTVREVTLGPGSRKNQR